MRAALILRAPLLIRLRFAADPSGWRPRYHPLRFARIIRFAPRCAARGARTASITPVPADSLRLRIRQDIRRSNASARFDHARTGRDRPERAKSQPEASTARAPVRWRVSWRAHRPAYQPATALRASASRQTAPRTRQKPPEARSAPEAGQTPARSRHRARAGPLARVVARAPTGIPARDSVTRQRFAPDSAQNAPEATRSPQRARSRADASQKPAPRARRSAGACRGARTDRHTSPRQRYAPALRARRQPQAPTARYFASARSPTRSGFDCDARALRNCNSTRPSCARRRRRSASVIGCGRPAWSHRMHSSFVRVGFSFLLHVHAGRYGCSASGFHSLTSSRSRNRSSSVRE
jgi:hypothetical protein